MRKPNPDLNPRPGEIQLKNFVQDEAAANGISESAIMMRLMRAKKRFYPNLTIRRATPRTVYVRVAAP